MLAVGAAQHIFEVICPPVEFSYYHPCILHIGSCMLPLIKVPCIFIFTTSLWVTLTPPQPPPEEDEEMEYGSLVEAIVKQRNVHLILKVSSKDIKSPVHSSIYILQYLISSLALIETRVLITQYTHHHPYSRFLLSHLIFSGGAAERICVSPPFLIGTFMASVGGLIRYKCYRTLGSMFTFEMSIRKDHILVTSGPYAIVRHPSYTGIILVAIAVSLVHGSKVNFTFILTVVVTSTEPISSGFLDKREWYSEYHGDEDSRGVFPCAGYNNDLWNIETDVKRG